MFSPGQQLLLRNGRFAHYVRPVFRLGGVIIEVVLADGSTRLVNARDVIATDWSGLERRQAERRQGERRRAHKPVRRSVLDRRKLRERRMQERRQFVVTRKPQTWWGEHEP